MTTQDELRLWIAGFNGLGLTTSPADDATIWDEHTGETYGAARARFATFGPLLDAEEALTYAQATDKEVMSFGYGQDPDGFDGIEAEELRDALSEGDPAAVMRDWGPFAPWLAPDADWVEAEHLAGRHDTESDLDCDICRELIPSVREADEKREAAGITDRSIDIDEYLAGRATMHAEEMVAPERPHIFASSIYPGAICSGPMGCGKTWEEHPPVDDPADDDEVTDDETFVTIRVPLPSGVVTPFAIDTEGIVRRDALVAFLLAHGITTFSTEIAPRCLSCGKTEAEHQPWCEDLGDTFIAPITPEVNS